MKVFPRLAAAGALLSIVSASALAQTPASLAAAAETCLTAGTRAVDPDPAKAIAPVERDLAILAFEPVLEAASACFRAAAAPQTPALKAARALVEKMFVVIAFGVNAPDAPEARLKLARKNMSEKDGFLKTISVYYAGVAVEHGIGAGANPEGALYWYRQSAALGSKTGARDAARLEQSLKERR